MSYELFIGLRYLRAKRKQTFISVNTFISIAGIFLGVAALIVVLAVMNGFETELRNKILGINSHIVLMKYTGSMDNYEEIAEAVKTVDGVAASTPFIYGQAMVKHRERVTGIVVRGISPKDALSVINFGTMKEGAIEDLTPEIRSHSLPGAPGIAIGTELARTLGVNLFDTVEIVLPMGIPTPMGIVPRIKKFRVVAVFDSGFYEYDSSLVFMSLADAQTFLNMKGEVTGIGIKIDDVYAARSVAKRVEKKLGFNYWARHWMEMNKNLFSALRLEKRVMFIILTLIVLVAAFSIITSLIMSVMEKTRDIAILKSMGATARSIMKIFMVQGLIIGAIGTTLGCITGITVALNLEKLAAYLEQLFGFKVLPQDVYYLNNLPSQVDYGDVLLIVAITTVICFLASVYPSWNASRLDPADALRYE